MSSNKMGLITICRKAGKLRLGMDMVKKACKDGEAFGVFTASDFSDKSLKEVKYVCCREKIPLYSLGITMDEISFELGKRVGVMAITDRGFCRSCAKDLVMIKIDENEFNSNN